MPSTQIDLSKLPPATKDEMAQWEKKLSFMGYAGRLRKFLDEFSPELAANNPVIREMEREYNSQLGTDLQQIRAGIRLLYVKLDAALRELGFDVPDTVLASLARSPQASMLETLLNMLLAHGGLTQGQVNAMLRTAVQLEGTATVPAVIEANAHAAQTAKPLAASRAKKPHGQAGFTIVMVDGPASRRALPPPEAHGLNEEEFQGMLGALQPFKRKPFLPELPSTPVTPAQDWQRLLNFFGRFRRRRRLHYAHTEAPAE